MIHYFHKNRIFFKAIAFNKKIQKLWNFESYKWSEQQALKND